MRVIVIGAGILGASSAYHLANAGAEVEIFDPELDGRATQAGAGIVCPWASAIEEPAWQRLGYAAARYYPMLVSALTEAGETDLGYRKVGALLVSADPGEIDAVQTRLETRRNEAPEMGRVERLGATEAQSLFPPLRSGLTAIRIEGAARMDGRRFAASLLRAAVGHGARLRRECAKLARDGGRARCLDSSGKTVAADAIIVTAGAWAAEILAAAGISHPVQPQKGQILHLGLSGVDTSRWPVLLPMNSYYMLAFDDSRVVVGATRETGSGFDTRVTAGGQAEVLDFALNWAPGLRSATLLETRVGLRPAGSSFVPILGPAPGLRNLHIGNGLGANGLTVGPYAGKLLADAVLGRNGEFDLADYRVAV